MSEFTARRLKEIRVAHNMSQDEAAKALNISKRKLISLEKDEHPLFVDDLMIIANFYKVDVREFLYESYVNENEELILAKRFVSILKLLYQLSDKDMEDMIWVMKQRIAGKI